MMNLKVKMQVKPGKSFGYDSVGVLAVDKASNGCVLSEGNGFVFCVYKWTFVGCSQVGEEGSFVWKVNTDVRAHVKAGTSCEKELS